MKSVVRMYIWHAYFCSGLGDGRLDLLSVGMTRYRSVRTSTRRCACVMCSCKTLIGQLGRGQGGGRGQQRARAQGLSAAALTYLLHLWCVVRCAPGVGSNSMLVARARLPLWQPRRRYSTILVVGSCSWKAFFFVCSVEVFYSGRSKRRLAFPPYFGLERADVDSNIVPRSSFYFVELS